MTKTLSLIVEGDGEVEALPVLVRRIAAILSPELHLNIPRPVRVQRSKIRKPDEMEKAIQLAAAKGGRGAGILILLDADDDCPAVLVPELTRRAQNCRADLPISVVLACREFESWFIAAVDSLRARLRNQEDVAVPPLPEEIRGAKEWLRQRLARGRYSPTVDQPSLAAIIDLELARRAPSFDKLWREVQRLLACDSR